jgi:hypothetical protein
VSASLFWTDRGWTEAHVQARALTFDQPNALSQTSRARGPTSRGGFRLPLKEIAVFGEMNETLQDAGQLAEGLATALDPLARIVLVTVGQRTDAETRDEA